MTVIDAGGRWADGVTVGAYLAVQQPLPGSQPNGAAVGSAVVASGVVTFSDLTEGVSHVAWASGVGVRFMPQEEVLPEFDRRLNDRKRIDAMAVQLSEDGGGGGGGGGNQATLLWDADEEDYLPAELRTDTTLPREFIGPVDPASLGSVVGPVYGDRWTPTEEPAE